MVEDKNQTELEAKQTKADQKSTNRRLLIKEDIIVIIGMVVLLGVTFAVPFLPIAEWIRVVLLVIAFVAFFVMCFIALRLEQKAGFYECEKCKHRHVPTYLQVLAAMHVGRTRYMKCPNCGKWSWSKKVLTDKEEK